MGKLKKAYGYIFGHYIFFVHMQEKKNAVNISTQIDLTLTQNWIRLSPIRKFIGPSYDLRKKLDETSSSPIFFQIIARTNKFAYWTKKESNFFIVMYVASNKLENVGSF